MKRSALAILWAKTGLIWFVATMIFGMYLGLSGRFGETSAHAHLGILGWLSSLGFALLFALCADDIPLLRGRLQWGLFNLGVIVQVTSLWMVMQTGGGIWGMVIGLGGLAIIVAVLWIAATVWRGLRAD